MKYNIKAFWNGSVMSDLTLNKLGYSKLKKSLELDFFAAGDNSQELIEYLDWKEQELFEEYKSQGVYEMTSQEMSIHLLGINALVKRGLRKNDNNYGLMISMFK